jgi:Protein of unknown function (DUF1488)
VCPLPRPVHSDVGQREPELDIFVGVQAGVGCVEAQLAVSRTKLVSVQMPLTRPIANPPLATPKGIEFTLLDRSKIVRCIITKAALEKLASKELASDQFEPTFHKHQDRIEATASRKYEQSAVYRPPLTITPADLVAYRPPIQV